jgi:hypothetical protein
MPQTDRKRPAVSISSPQAGATVTNSTITVVGTAADKVGIARVDYRLENAAGTNEYQPAVGTIQWSANIPSLIPGVNTVRVRAVDLSGNVSPDVARSFTYLVLSPLTLEVSGNGTVSPDLNERLLQVGVAYKITAKPGHGFVFSSWTGVDEPASASLTFVMQSNLVLRANFAPNPFAAVQGSYAGLFSDPDGASFDNSGWFSATVTSGGRFSSTVRLAGKSYRFAGQFSAAGTFAGAVPRRGLTPLSVQLQLDLGDADRITGTLGGSGFTAQVRAHRATFSRTNPAQMAGKRYTLVIPPGGDPSTAPGGYGYGTLTIDVAGNVKFAGALGDGSKISQRTFLSKAGEWPLFASLYRGKGLSMGWLAVNGNDLMGKLRWFKLPQPTAKFYPSGFALSDTPEAIGSVYSYTKGSPSLNLTNGGVVILANGNLPGSTTNAFVLDANNRVVGSNRMTAAITPATGLFRGKAPNPANNRFVSFAGVLIQNKNVGWGCFVGSNRTGQVYFGPPESQPPPSGPTVTIAATDPTASESEPSWGSFTISRTGSTAAELTVRYAVGGTAANGSDYATLPGSITIPEDSPSASVTVIPVDDAVSEATETVVLTLSSDPAYTVGSHNSATVTIMDNESEPGAEPAMPSRILNLNNWKLTLPVETSRPGSPDEVMQPELRGYQDTNYFRVNGTRDGVLFTAPCGGATTGGSSYPRSELREMKDNGSTQAGWSTTIGTHTMEIRQAITHLPTVKPHVVAGQIHDANDDVIVFRLEGTKLFVDQNGVNGPVLNASYRLGDVFTVKFVAHDGGVECHYDGRYIYTYPVRTSGCYFKAGCYTQSNTSRGDAPSAYGAVVVYDVKVTHQ